MSAQSSPRPRIPPSFTTICSEVIWSGAFVGTIVPPPATLLLNAPQYETGKVLADAAIAYINAKLGGKATVVLLTQDTMQYLDAAFPGDAARNSASCRAWTIVADIAPSPVNKQGGYDDHADDPR